MANIPRAFALSPSLTLALALALVLVATPLCTAECALFFGEKLTEEKPLESGSFRLVMYSNCELVLYNKSVIIWSSNTARLATCNCYLKIERDANLVIYTAGKEIVWRSGTHLEEGYYALILRKNGRLVTYGPHSYVGQTTAFGALPANNAADEPKTSGINMVVNN